MQNGNTLSIWTAVWTFGWNVMHGIKIILKTNRNMTHSFKWIFLIRRTKISHLDLFYSVWKINIHHIIRSENNQNVKYFDGLAHWFSTIFLKVDSDSEQSMFELETIATERTILFGWQIVALVVWQQFNLFDWTSGEDQK